MNHTTTATHPLRIQRHRQGITQEALAAKTGLSRETILRIEGFKNAPTRSTLKLLGMGLDVDPETLRA